MIDCIHPPLDRTSMQIASNLQRNSVDKTNMLIVLSSIHMTYLIPSMTEYLGKAINPLKYPHTPVFFYPDFIYTKLRLAEWVSLKQVIGSTHYSLFILNLMKTNETHLHSHQ